MTIMDGQTDALAMLAEMNRPVPRADVVRRSLAAAQQLNAYAPTPEEPAHCTMCGRQLHGHFDISTNHSPWGWYEGQRLCSAMVLTRNHVGYYAGMIRERLDGLDAQCCYSKADLHGKSVKNPTPVQASDHLRQCIERARTTWGVRADLFDAWLGGFLLDHGLLKWALDPSEYPWEYENPA